MKKKLNVDKNFNSDGIFYFTCKLFLIAELEISLALQEVLDRRNKENKMK